MAAWQDELSAVDLNVLIMVLDSWHHLLSDTCAAALDACYCRFASGGQHLVSTYLDEMQS